MATDRDDESAQATTPVCKLRRQSRNSAVGADRGRFGGFLACAVAPGDDACVWKTKLISVDTTTKRADASPPPSCGPTKKQQMESNQRATHLDPPGARAWRPDVGCKAMAASPRARSMRATPQGMAEARFRGRKAPRALARNPFFSGALPFLRVRRAAPPGGGASGLGGVMEPAEHALWRRRWRETGWGRLRSAHRQQADVVPCAAVRCQAKHLVAVSPGQTARL